LSEFFSLGDDLGERNAVARGEALVGLGGPGGEVLVVDEAVAREALGVAVGVWARELSGITSRA